MAGKQKLIDKIIKWLWYLVASSILVSAVIISLVRFALTEIDSYQEAIEQLASKATGHQVFIESLRLQDGGASFYFSFDGGTLLRRGPSDHQLPGL